MIIKIIIAHYKSEYDDYATNDIIGSYTNDDDKDKLISEYKNKKIKYHAECLLKDTSYIIKEIELNKSCCISIPSY